jgi:arabinogalactan endo-1,4-beta-galactosidase
MLIRFLSVREPLCEEIETRLAGRLKEYGLRRVVGRRGGDGRRAGGNGSLGDMREDVRLVVNGLKRAPLPSAALLTVLVLMSMILISDSSPTRTPRDPLQIRGADISFTLLEEAAGKEYSERGSPLPIERILAANGADYVRLRVWVNPIPGYSDEASALTLARRARKAGLKLLLAFHYSDTWADTENQTTPAAWLADDFPTLRWRVRDYTRRVVGDFARQGTPVDIVQVGNEVTNGMLWPAGMIYRATGEDWASFSTLLGDCIAGARAGAPGRRPAIVIHVDRGGDNRGARYFFDRIIESGVTSFDMIGLSYYPFWHGPLAHLRANLDDLSDRYGKNLIVLETAYPWTLPDGDPDAWVTDARQLPDAEAYPPTVRGQERYYRALRRVLQQVPGRRAVGFFVWEPGWLPGVGWKPGASNPSANLTLFDSQGRALPSVASAFAQSVEHP